MSNVGTRSTVGRQHRLVPGSCPNSQAFDPPRSLSRDRRAMHVCMLDRPNRPQERRLPRERTTYRGSPSVHGEARLPRETDHRGPSTKRTPPSAADSLPSSPIYLPPFLFSFRQSQPQGSKARKYSPPPKTLTTTFSQKPLWEKASLGERLKTRNKFCWYCCTWRIHDDRLPGTCPLGASLPLVFGETVEVLQRGR